MIFVTVGHQIPFDRMVRLVDEWAGRTRRRDVYAQIGETDYCPKHIAFEKYLSRSQFDACLERCSRVVAHAGVGTIIQAIFKQKPLLVLPRLSSLRETRSDHQVGTAKHFAAQGQLLAAFDDTEFLAALDRLEAFTPRGGVGLQASPELLARIQAFLDETMRRRA